MALAEPVCVLLCRNWKRRRTRGRRSGWSLNGRGGSGRRSESGRESGGIVRGRRNERGSGRGKESENGRETETKTATKIATVGPEKESGTENGRGTEAARGALTAAGPGKGKLNLHVKRFQIESQKSCVNIDCDRLSVYNKCKNLMID